MQARRRAANRRLATRCGQVRVSRASPCSGTDEQAALSADLAIAGLLLWRSARSPGDLGDRRFASPAIGSIAGRRSCSLPAAFSSRDEKVFVASSWCATKRRERGSRQVRTGTKDAPTTLMNLTPIHSRHGVVLAFSLVVYGAGCTASEVDETEGADSALSSDTPEESSSRHCDSLSLPDACLADKGCKPCGKSCIKIDERRDTRTGTICGGSMRPPDSNSLDARCERHSADSAEACAAESGCRMCGKSCMPKDYRRDTRTGTICSAAR
jgi:hypothetical protein